MAVTDAQKVQIRRHMGYPVMGLMQFSPGGASLGTASSGYRFFQAYGLMEWRLNNLQVSEEAALVGSCAAGIALVGVQPTVGQTASVVFAGGGIVGGPITITTPAFATSGTDGRLVLCQQLASLVSLNVTLQAAGIYAATPYGTGPFAQNAVPLPEVGFVGPTPFTISATSTGALAPVVTSQGVNVAPSTTLDGGITTIYGYLNILNGLESAYAGASDNLDTSKADVWTARSNELGLRTSLYINWRAMLSDFLGVPVNPQRRRENDPSRHGAIRFA
jgi:hypothetical protein